ncbi:MAG: hypothetical protein M1834_003678 [Cirrosporium novae-zelandiae]|nr:MAG: hypothetical protein M1834_003678 [Cirrosporium novae-zelandiae]
MSVPTVPELEIQSIIFTPSQLRNSSYLPELMTLMNNAFGYAFRDLFPPPPRGRYRFSHPSQIVDAVGEYGRCCVLFMLDQDQKTPVAITALKPYKEDPSPRGPSPGGSQSNVAVERPEKPELETQCSIQGNMEEATTDWEIACVAVKDDPRFRKKGLAIRCIEELERDLSQRLAKTGDYPNDKENGVTAKLTSWIRCHELIEPYWAKRGFQQVKEKMMPIGFWGNIRPFRLVFMRRPMIVL